MKFVAIYKQFVNFFLHNLLSRTATRYNKMTLRIQLTIRNILIYMNLDNYRRHLPQLLIFILSLADDALLLALSRIGWHFTWLRWLSPVLTGGTVLHFGWQLYRHKMKNYLK